MVGTGIVLSPHEYFQFDQTLKNVVVNSESAFWDILVFHKYLPKIFWDDMAFWICPSYPLFFL